MFLNGGPKKNFFKKFYTIDIISISTKANNNSLNINLNVQNTVLSHYALYVYITQIYLNVNMNYLHLPKKSTK